jgi:hypothetical protein
MSLLARAVATMAHDVITEYRKLCEPPPADAPEPEPARQEMSCMGAATERRPERDFEAAPAFGFTGPPQAGAG